MRKALLVIILIAAAFVGGAAVNGPGLAWARKYVAVHLGGGPMVALDGDDVIKADGDAHTPNATARTEAPSEVPAAPLRSLRAQDSKSPESNALVIASENSTAPSDKPQASQTTEPRAISSSMPSMPAELSVPPQAPPPGLPKNALASQGESTKGGDSGWSDVPGSSAPAKPVLPRRGVEASSPSANHTRAQQGKAAVGPLLDAAVKPAGLARIPSTSAASELAASPEWAMIRQRMKAMGVSRYWIDADVAGTVRFRCVIPLADTRAVAQHFEAEGATELQAADAALRRVALWRATEQ